MHRRALPELLPGAVDADVPVEIVPADDREVARAVRADPTLVAPLVVRRVAAPVATFERLLDDLPATANLVRRLGLGRYRIERRPDGTVEIEDGLGARARVACICAAPGIRVYRARGGLDVFPAPSIQGTGIVTLRYAAAGEGALLTGGQIFFRTDGELVHRLARPLIRVVQRAVDAKIQALVAAAMAACEHEATPGDQIRSGGKRAG